MDFIRRHVSLGMVAAGLGAGAAGRSTPAGAQAAATTDSVVGTPAAAHQATYFFKNSAFEFVFLTSLGRAFHQGGNVGKVLYTIRQVEDGNFESAWQVTIAAGHEMRALAEESASGGHVESARQAYLWAQNFYDCATYFADGSGDPTRVATAWQLMDDCWLKSLALFDPPIEQVAIPYEGTTLRGFYFRARGGPAKRPLLILTNGSDGSALDMWMIGAGGAAARGYDCLTFDGPGQGYALWKQQLYFRPDWEKVVTDVIGRITCPMLITEPANEAFWPGQSRRLYDLLKAPKTIVPFSAADGADLHCEPKGYGLRDLRVYNWLDKTLR